MHKKTIFIWFVSVLFFGIISCSDKATNNSEHSKSFNSKESLINANRVLVKKDKQRIEGYVKRNAWKMQETNTGLWLEIIEKGSGQKAQLGLYATIDYKISLLDGTICYSSDKTGQKIFEIGHGGVEAGLEQGILMCREGTKARFIMPPHLAYGLTGDGDKIPARSIIVYEVEVKRISDKR
jgi:FKBP-type peptidyl-prolyl cis-trans isomerase FkpA